MKAVIQRVDGCTVKVGQTIISEIGNGLLVLVGVEHTDTDKEAEYLAKKLVHLRIFEDQDGRLNRSLLDIAGSMLVVSQFTVLGDCRKGRRPSFSSAANPDLADILYGSFCNHARRLGVAVKTGQFGEHMSVSLVNNGPVTLIVESPPNH